MLAIPKPNTPTQVSFSPRNSQASKLIWISMVLLMMLDSIAVSTCKLLFHNQKARAVLTTANSIKISHDLLLKGGKP